MKNNNITTAKMQFEERGFFDRVKERINPQHFVECGLCGAIEVEAMALARLLYDSTDDDLFDLSFECLRKLLDEPVEEDYKKWLNYEEWLKFEVANKHRFFIADDYGEGTCVKYEKVVLYCNSVCDCFGKDKIKNLL